MACSAVRTPLEASRSDPGAYEGFGYATVGGTGGSTCHVTSLASSGLGSLYDCVTDRSGPTVVVFDVSGTIVPEDVLRITDPYLTVDGSTAPATGIVVRPSGFGGGSGFVIENTHDVIIRGLRLVGYNPTGTTDGDADLIALDGTEGGEVYNVVVDHVTLTAADDGGSDITGNVHDVTASLELLLRQRLEQSHQVRHATENQPSPQRLRPQR